jgi:hypothetical protein
MTMLKRQSETKKQELEPPLPFENLYHQYHLRIYLYEIAISPPGRGVAATGSAGTAGSRLFVSPLSGIISF